MENLLRLVNEKQQKMFEFADVYGFTSEQTVKCSQQLDELLNQLLREEHKKI